MAYTHSTTIRWVDTGIIPLTDTGGGTYLNDMRFFSPARTNLCTNPMAYDGSANGQLDQWTNSSTIAGTPTYTCVNGVQRIQYTGVAGDAAGDKELIFWLAVGGFAVGDPVTLQAVMSGSSTGVTVRLVSLTTPGYATIADTTVTLTATPTVNVATGVIGAGGTGMRMYVRVSNIGTGGVVDLSFTKVMAEKSSILTPYFDGNTPGCAWSSTADASTSVWAANVLRFPTGTHLAAENGTVAFRGASLWPGDFVPVDPLQWFGTNNAKVGVHQSTGRTYLYLLNGSTSDYHANAWLAGTAHSFVARWSNPSTATYYLDVDGVSDAGRTGVTATIGTLTDFWVGATNLGVRQPYAYIGPVIVSPSYKSDAWVAAIQANNGAAFSDTALLLGSFMEIGDMLIPLKSDNLAWVKR